MFSSAFSSAFARPHPRPCICPMMAQAALMDGAAWSLVGSSLVIGDKLLIGPAGKVFEFLSEESAARWAANTAAAGAGQVSIIAGLSGPAAAAWVARKREKLAVIAGRLVAAAARQGDERKRAALLAESDFCYSKWAAV